MAQSTLLFIIKADLITANHNVAKQLNVYVPDLIVEKADVITSWEANARYYPTKIIRRDVIRKVIREIHKWHSGLARQGIK